MDISNSFHTVNAVAAFLGGWCGTVPISLIIWYILHGKVPPPPPDSFFKISMIGAFTGLVIGSIVSIAINSNTAAGAGSILVSGVTGIMAGAIAGGIAAKSALANVR